jgi:hypothetical protein
MPESRCARTDLDLLLKELVEAFEWTDSSWVHAVEHVSNAVHNLRADVRAAQRLELAQVEFSTVLEERVAELEAMLWKWRTSETDEPDDDLCVDHDKYLDRWGGGAYELC